MLVEKKRLIELLSHEDGRVRSAAIEALENFFFGSGDVIEHLLKAIDSYKYDIGFVLELMTAMKNFIPTEEDAKKILRLYIETIKDNGDSAEVIELYLSDVLIDFPFQLLENNYATLSPYKDLVRIYRGAKEVEQVRSLEPEVLWEQLTERCERYYNKKMDDFDNINCKIFVESLSQKQMREKIKDNVIKYLSQTTDVNYYLEDFLVNLAGNLKLEETVPYLFRILIDSDFMDYVYSSCIRSLGKIGTPEVVKEIGTLYGAYPNLRISLAEILKYIPYDYSEDMAIRLLQDETDPGVITFLAGSLCDIFSIKSGPMILDIIREKRYNPVAIHLLDILVPVYAYHDKTIDNLAELEKEDIPFREAALEAEPLFRMLRHNLSLNKLKAKLNSEPVTPRLENIDWGRKMPRNRIPSKKKHKKKKRR